MMALVTLYILSVPILWVFYLAVMNLSFVKDQLSPEVYKMGMAIMYIGLVWDVLVNILVATVIFMQLPHELTVSARLRTLVLQEGWRSRLAIYFAERLMNPFSGSTPHIPLKETT